MHWDKGGLSGECLKCVQTVSSEAAVTLGTPCPLQGALALYPEGCHFCRTALIFRKSFSFREPSRKMRVTAPTYLLGLSGGLANNTRGRIIN